jgi:hypothetical protein
MDARVSGPAPRLGNTTERYQELLGVGDERILG